MKKTTILALSGLIAIGSFSGINAQDAKAQARIQQALAKCAQIDTRLAQVQTLKVTKGNEAKAKRIIDNLKKSAGLCADFRTKNENTAPKTASKTMVGEPVGVLDNATRKAATAKAMAAAKISGNDEAKPAADAASSCAGLKNQYALVASAPKTRQNQKILAGLKVAIAKCAKK